MRGGAGLLVSSYKVTHGATNRDPAGDNAAGIALMKQAVKLGETFSEAAKTHQTVALATSIGSVKAGASTLSDKEAPLAALMTAVSGMVGGDSLDAARADAGSRKTSPDDGSLPHSADPVIALSAKAGLGVTACLPYAAPMVTLHGLVMRPLIAPELTRTFHLYTKNTRTPSPAAASFLAFLAAFVQRPAGPAAAL